MAQKQPPSKAIHLCELKDLLHNLTHQESRTLVKLEIAGKMMPDYFSTVLVFEKHALLLTHLPTRSVLNVPHLDQVTAFMVDQPHQMFLPFERYVVKSESVERKFTGK